MTVPLRRPATADGLFLWVLHRFAEVFEEHAVLKGQPSRVVRVMAPGAALAHKLAAWNERRLVRDLYDAWFLSARIGAKVDAPCSMSDCAASTRNTRQFANASR